MNQTGLPYLLQRSLIQLLLTLLISTFFSPFTSSSSANADQIVNWTKQAGSGARLWSSIASSSDGTQLAVADREGLVYTSADSGATWVSRFTSNREWSAISLSGNGRTLAATIYGDAIFSLTDSAEYLSGRGFLYYSDRGMVVNSGNRNWSSITSNENGGTLTAVVDGGYVYTSSDSGVTWTEQTSSGSRNWKSISSSSDGTKLAAAANGGYIHTSSNSGLTWETRTASGVRSWRSIASSSDGTRLAAAANGGSVYTSSDSGVTWAEQPSSGSRNWKSISSSSDGTKLAAVDGGGFIYTSANSGVTWILSASSGSRNWSSIASSADGTKLAAVVDGGLIYTSIDSGVSWNERSGLATRDWRSIASSSDGNKIAAVSEGDYIFTSTDSGTNWTERGERESWRAVALNADGSQIVAAALSARISRSTNTGLEWTSLNSICLEGSSGFEEWKSITSSSDGTKLAAIEDGSQAVGEVGLGGYICTSSNSGITWQAQTSMGPQFWKSIISSSDGTRLAALGENTYIYTSSNSGLTWETRTASGLRSWRSIASSSDGTSLAALGENTYIYTSSNSGLTWETRTASGLRSWRSIASSSDGTRLAALGENTYIYTSSNSGLTWETQTVSGVRNWNSITLNSNGTKIAAAEYQGFIWTGEFQASSPPSNSFVAPVVPTYLVNYLGNTAGVVTDVPASVSAVTGTKIIIPTQLPRRTGYTFVSWNSAASGSGIKYLPGDIFEVSSTDVTLYAQWKINTYSLVFNANGGPALKLDTQTRDYGSTEVLPTLSADQLRTGYTFLGWNSAMNGSGANYQSAATFRYPAVDTTLYAQWKINTYSLTYEGNSHQIGRVPTPSTQDFGSSSVIKAPSQTFTRKGFTFKGWNTSKDGSGTSYAAGAITTQPAADLILYAHWSANTYQVKFLGNSREPLPNGEFVTGGSITSAPTPIKTGYVFKGWSSTPSRAQILSLPYSPGVTRNITLYAVWVKG